MIAKLSTRKGFILTHVPVLFDVMALSLENTEFHLFLYLRYLKVLRPHPECGFFCLGPR